jgi:RNA polymerase sigma factor (sigma-70 family)
MNILPKGDQAAIAEDSKAGNRRRALLNDRLPWLPADFTSLKSPHAVLDDRIQIANMGLLRAARIFTPGVMKDGKPVPFMAFAAQIIKHDLTTYVRRGTKYTPRELPGSLETPLYIPSHIGEAIAQAHRDDWREAMTPERREELLGFERMQDLVSLDELYFANAANEEVEDEIQEPPLLSANEVLPIYGSDPTQHITESLLSRSVHDALKTLSEREAGVLRLRYGLTDGQQHTLDEIGEVYGVTRDRIRQIETNTMKKMRHPSRAELLSEFMDFDDGGQQPMRSGDVIKTKHCIGRTTVQLTITPADTEFIQPPKPRLSWQAYPGESWDEPVRKTAAQLEAEHAASTRQLKELLFGASLYTFQKSFAEEMRSPYPKLLFDKTMETFGRELKPSGVADFWNNHLESFLDHLVARLGDDASPDRVMQLLSRLLSERMDDNDEVTLNVPEHLQGKLGYVGAWLAHGTVRVHGDVGDNVGYEMSSLSHLQLDGSAGHFAGSHMKGNARLEIDGDAGDFLGFAMRGQASILVNGDVGTYCGNHMKGDTRIEIVGGAGHGLGFEASGGEIVVEQETKK